jgi:hypothetical protein
VGGTVLLIVVLVVIAIVIGFAFLAPGGFARAGVQPGALRAERRHDWETLLDERHEDQLLAGIAAFRDAGHDLSIWHEAARLDLFDPPRVISLYALVEVFLDDLRKAPDADARALVAGLLSRWTTTEIRGRTLHLSRDWAKEPVVGDPARFSELAGKILSNATVEVAGIEGAQVDEVRGAIDLMVRAERTPNVVVVDLARVAVEIRRRRDEGDETPLPTLLRSILRAAIARDAIPSGASHEAGGVLWMRPPSEAERAIAIASVERSEA